MVEHATTTLVVGRRKFGKSKYTKETIIPNYGGPVVVLDVKGEYGPENGFHEIYYNADDFLNAPKFKRASVRVTPGEDADTVLECLQHYGPHLLVVDEAHLYCTSHGINEHLGNLVRMGAEPGISIVLISQRVRDFPPVVFGMADKIIVFQQRHERDVMALESVLESDDVIGINKLERDEYREFEL